MIIAKNHQKNIKFLKIDRADVNFNLKMLQIVDLTLTNLSLDYVDKKLDYPYDKIKINFPNLKILNLNYSGLILRHIGEHKITEMTIREEEEKLREFNEFLETCEDLKKLTLEDFLPSYDPEVHKYQLEALSCYFCDNQNEIRIKKFLKPHKKTLKKLICGNHGWNFVKYSINKMKIDELFIDGINLQSDEALKVNKNIKNLKVSLENYESRPQMEGLSKIIEACVHVEKFTLECPETIVISRKDLKFICENMKNLKFLTLPRMTTFVNLITFKNLEILKISEVFSKDEHKS
jgi:hypothetical protein